MFFVSSGTFSSLSTALHDFRPLRLFHGSRDLPCGNAHLPVSCEGTRHEERRGEKRKRELVNTGEKTEKQESKASNSPPGVILLDPSFSCGEDTVHDQRNEQPLKRDLFSLRTTADQEPLLTNRTLMDVASRPGLRWGVSRVLTKPDTSLMETGDSSVPRWRALAWHPQRSQARCSHSHSVA